MRAVLFGGTTEGRLLSRALADHGVDIVVSVATEVGCEEQGVYPGVEVVSGAPMPTSALTQRIPMPARRRGSSPRPR